MRSRIDHVWDPPFKSPHTLSVAAYADECQFQPCHVNRTHRTKLIIVVTHQPSLRRLVMTYFCVDAPDQERKTRVPQRTFDQGIHTVLCHVALCNVL